MKYKKACLFLSFVVPFLVMNFPAGAFPEAERKDLLPDNNEPIVIHSNSFEVDYKQYIVTFMGDVNVKNGDLTIGCQKIYLYYQNLPDIDSPGITRSSIDKIIAEGQVRISRPAGWLAMAEKAVYYSDEAKFVLTGKPIIKKGDDFVEGARITLFLNENRSIVEGSGDEKAKAVLFPRNDQR